MKKSESILWGIIIIIIGTLFLGNTLNIWDIDIFFKGWWTLFIIVPSIFGLIKEETWASSIIGISIGVLLLLATRDVIDWSMVWKLFVSILLIIIGLACIFKRNGVKIKQINKKGNPEYIGIFSGTEEKITDEFNGANCVSVFGSVTIDLTSATIKNDVVLECVSVFGGIDIKVPDNVIVKTNGVPVFGGAENKASQSSKKDSPTIYINYVCIFSGIEVK